MMNIRLLLLCLVSIFSASLAVAEPNPLYEKLSRVKEVAVFIKTPSDSGASKLDAERFRASLEKALKERKSIHFVPATSESDARVVVEADIKGFMFSETDPVDMLAGVGMAAMDAAKIDHFASVDVHMTVKEAGSAAWDDTVHASITDETMTETESRDRILDRASEVFVRSAFGKNK